MNLDHVLRRPFPDVHSTYTWKDSALYALGIGYGSDPLDESDLRFVYERDQLSTPSQCVVLGHPGFWHREPETGIDWKRILHGEHFFEIHRPLPAAASIRARHRIDAVADKGPDQGALLYFETQIDDSRTGEPLATVRATQFLRGDGGCGSHGTPPASPRPLPAGEPTRIVEVRTLPQAALIYRLSGDYNPLHVDPAVAKSVGFERPILHGLCTMGVACRTILRTFCGNEPSRLSSMFVRFSKPIFPGETIRFDFHEEGGGVLTFRATAVERDALVLDRCRATLA